MLNIDVGCGGQEERTWLGTGLGQELGRHGTGKSRQGWVCLGKGGDVDACEGMEVTWRRSCPSGFSPAASLALSAVCMTGVLQLI